MSAALAFALLVLLSPTQAAPGRPAVECDLDATETPADLEAIAAFRADAGEYAALHRRLERALLLDHRAMWPEEGEMESELLGEAIKAALPNAHPGSMLQGRVAELIRARIGRASWVRRYHGRETGAPPATVRGAPPRVHDWWHEPLEPSVRPWLARVLPALPPELEYRFAGRHLVLVDGHARLVIDVLENALPEP